ncbi:MAG: enoyl-CoA hydratase/isomerase family protein [Haloarculaceae archaeon]
MPVTTTVEGDRATVTIDRPERKNSLPPSVLQRIGDEIEEVAGDVRAVVVTGVGDVFSSGADVDEFMARTDDPEAVVDYLGHFGALYDRIESAPVPVVARVNGPAYGGGYELVMACDLRVAADTAELCPAEINMGLIPPFERLRANLSEARVRELCFTGDTLDAREAADAGVYNEVVSPEDLDAATDDLVERVVSTSPNAVAQTKRAMVDSARGGGVDVDTYRSALDVQCAGHPDFEESVTAFTEGRSPDYDHEG